MEQRIQKMTEWLKDITKEKLQVMGMNGLEIIQRRYTKDVVTEKYVELIDFL